MSEDFDERLADAAARLKAQAGEPAEHPHDPDSPERFDEALAGLEQARSGVSNARRALAEIESRLDGIRIRRLP